ncbi:MAG: hypothetical protein ACI9BW_003866, partial [Gammaproteobacteria bacterium]
QISSALRFIQLSIVQKKGRSFGCNCGLLEFHL